MSVCESTLCKFYVSSLSVLLLSESSFDKLIFNSFSISSFLTPYFYHSYLLTSKNINVFNAVNKYLLAYYSHILYLSEFN